MKITESTFKRIAKAVNSYLGVVLFGVTSDVWETPNQDVTICCRIFFEDVDGRKYRIVILNGEMSIYTLAGRGKWCGSIDLTGQGWDDVMMWLGQKLYEAYKAADALEEEQETE